MRAAQSVLGCSAEQVLRVPFKVEREFTGNTLQHDDMTLLVLKVDGVIILSPFSNQIIV